MKGFSIKLFGITGAAMMFSSLAFGQATCATAITPTTVNFIRAEGQTELLPTFTFSCTSGAPATLSVQFYLSPSVTITSTAVNTTTSEINLSSTGATTAAALAVPANASTVNGSSFTIGGIAVAAGTTTYTVSNVRVNATSIPSPNGGAPVGITIQGFASGTGVTPGAISAGGGAPVLAYVSNGLQATTVWGDAATSGQQNKIQSAQTGTPGSFSYSSSFGVCGSLNNSGSSSAAPSFVVKFAENFSNAFKTLADEAAGATLPETATSLNSGTRLKIALSNVPAGLSVYAPITVTNGTLTLTGQISETAKTNSTSNNQTPVTTPAQLKIGTLTQGANSYQDVASSGVYQVPVTNGTATIIYEVTAESTGASELANVPVYLQAGTAAITAGSPALTVAASFATANPVTSVPSFALGTSTTSVTLLSFTQCTTSLLFPFVSNANGFETGFAISNTTISASPTGFANTGVKQSGNAQSGTCTLALYGQSVAGQTPIIVAAPNTNENGQAAYNPSEAYSFTLTSALPATAPAFTGFAIAQCNFQYAHGFAYITYGGLGTPNAVAMGYLAEVLTGRGTNSAEGVSF